MKTKLIAATAAFALMGGVAMAQDKSSSMQDTTMTPPTAADPMIPSGTDASTTVSTTTDAATSTTTATTTDATGATVTTSLTTNGPVPDTAENRAKYGQPMSNAGKRTKAVGN